MSDHSTECKEQVVQALNQLLDDSDKSYDTDRIRDAIELAISSHDGQRRRSGEEYVCHPLHVACILVEIGMDTDAVIAGLLHDVVEDTEVGLEEIARRFGQSVADLVDGVTKITQMTFYTREEQQAENVRKMLLAMSKDVRVMIIKLADRLHNMRTSSGWDPQKQRDKARETLDIYAPLAHRLGIRTIKEELEDLSLRVLDPIAYREIEENLALHADERKAFLQNIQQRLHDQLAEYGLEANISGRIKSHAGIYRKMYMRGKAFDEIFDIYAVRVIVDNVNDCYNALGVVHEMFRPLPNRFKDYISTPKPNMYQSLHTTVVSREKIAFEVQIRTWEMHYTAEYGIAAHWKYKAGIRKHDKLEDRLAWVRQFIESQQDVDDAEDIVRGIKTDLDIDDVFVFTPKGDVITLPEGSTVIDFAYAIHTAVGNRMVGAKVNGRIVPLDYKVKTGELVEILTTSAANRGPSRDWLSIVHTSEARNKIRSWFKKERREENIQQGREELERELSRNLIRLSGEKMEQFLLYHARRQHCATLDDFYAAIGYGGVMLSRLIPRMKEDYARMLKEEQAAAGASQPVTTTPPPSHRHNGGVIIDQVEDCLVKFAQCCNPVPGDPIIGFITRGYGVSIHRRDCTNVPKDIAASPNAERWVSVQWEQSVNTSFHANLRIVAHDSNNLLLKLTTVLAGMHVPMHSVNARDQDAGAVVSMTISVNSVEHLQVVINKLCAVDGVDAVQRTGNV